MTTTEFTVGTADLRQALRAVTPHVGKATGMPEYARVRFIVGRENVTLVASDRFTMAMAIVSIWERDDAEAVAVAELHITDIAKILAIHKLEGADTGDEPDYQLRFVVTDENVVATDVSGMIEGRSLRVPRLATEDALSAVPRLFESAHSGQLALIDGITDLTMSGDHIARFRDAGKAYGASLSWETRRGVDGKRRLSVIVRCGDSFLGLMVPRTVQEEDRVKAKQNAEDWAYRLPDIARTAPEAEADLLARAVELVVTTQHAAPSLLQRRLIIGFARAKGLLDKMQDFGIVGPQLEGRDTRTVFVRSDELVAAQQRIAAASGSEA